MKKIEHIWSIVCTNSTTDQQSNNISLFNLVEKFSVVINKKDNPKIKEGQKFTIPFRQELVIRFMKKSKNIGVIFDLRIDVVSPSSNITKGKDIKTINFDKKLLNMRIRNKINDIPVGSSGLYYFSIKVKEVGETKFEEVALVPIEIDIKIEE